MLLGKEIKTSLQINTDKNRSTEATLALLTLKLQKTVSWRNNDLIHQETPSLPKTPPKKESQEGIALNKKKPLLNVGTFDICIFPDALYLAKLL